MTSVDFHFDFISPYSFLALHRASEFETQVGARFRMRPVVYGALLAHHGLTGPVEVEARREHAFRDVLRLAEVEGLRLEGPPSHPFRSLDALRCFLAHAQEGRELELARRLSEACWVQGRDLESHVELAAILREHGLNPEGLETRLSAPEIKQALRAETEAAIRVGVFGVPSFVFEGELFWGHDRMDLLARRLSGELDGVETEVRRLLDRPRGLERKR